MTESTRTRKRIRGRSASIRRAAEGVARTLIQLSGWVAIVVLAAIFLFLIQNSLKASQEIGLGAMITGTDWYPTTKPPSYGFLPAEVGSLWVTFVAMLLSIPISIAAAIYISEFAGPRVREVSKSLVEFLAAVPSVVLGLIGLALVAPAVAKTFDLSSGLTALTAGLVVGLVTFPTIISISEDALRAVPRDLRTGSLALGNTRWQTTYKVVVPAASSGIFAAVMLGLGRAIGETMVVLMVAGNSGIIATNPLEAVRTMTGTIAQEMGEVVRGGLHFSVLFAMGLVLFTVTFVINLAADVVLERQRRRWRR
ncbi:MAG: phosphate ABC transporter permease subunit PstC [Coriobacteriales bacterium]|nr:phosphate ABC transporter permease subunit PstC [Coriobacteriales bacterium]